MELGKNFSEFSIKNTENIWKNISTNGNSEYKEMSLSEAKVEFRETILYKDKHCMVRKINKDTTTLCLITGNSNESIII